tara:strand:+ start:4552 stop:4914 length:363 start_codon:yes stop_codon:yes gene_type:complete
MFEKITSENVIMYAIKNYNNPQCQGELEFYDDLKRFKYIKRLFKKFSESGELRERLLLNHFIVLNNVFGSDAAITLLLFKIEKEHWGIMKSFLIYLNMLEKHELSDVRADEHVLDVLRKI